MPQLDSNLVALSLALLHCREDMYIEGLGSGLRDEALSEDDALPSSSSSNSNSSSSSKRSSGSRESDSAMGEDVRILGNPPLPPLPITSMVTHVGADQHDENRLQRYDPYDPSFYADPYSFFRSMPNAIEWTIEVIIADAPSYPVTANLRLDLLYRTLDPFLHPDDYVWGLDRFNAAQEKQQQQEQLQKEKKEQQREQEQAERQRHRDQSRDRRRRRESVRRGSKDLNKDGLSGNNNESKEGRDKDKDRESVPVTQEQQLLRQKQTQRSLYPADVIALRVVSIALPDVTTRVAVQVSLSLGFKGLFLYTVNIYCNMECSIRQLWYSSIKFLNITNIAYIH